MKKLTQSQVNRKFSWKYVEFYKTFDYSKQMYLYEIRNVYDEIRENTSRWEDVWTSMEYTR